MKSEDPKDIFTKATEAIKQCFSEVPFCTLQPLKPEEGSMHVDRVESLCIEEKEFTLLIGIKSSGQPRFVREAINALARDRSQFKWPYCLFVAPFISEEARKILVAEDIGYLDLAGNCLISLDKIYIRKEGRANRFTKKRDLQSLYSPKAERVLRALLQAPKRAWKVEMLAEVAQVSLGQVSNVKKLLDGREWLRRGSDGFRLVETEKLLLEWAANYKLRRSRVKEFYSLNSLTEIERQVSELRDGKRFGALTGFSAAARLAPAVRYNRVSAYAYESGETVAEKLGWKAVTSGANVSLIEPYDSGVFLGSGEVEGQEIVSSVQIYLDLIETGGRGEEASEALLREVLKPSW